MLNILQQVAARWVKLLIEDTRISSLHGHPKMSQEVLLVVVDEGSEGEWRTELHDLLYELQKSNSAITGIGAL